MRFAQYNLTVACQPAAEIGLFLLVAVNTKPHLKLCALDPVHGFHRSMTLSAFDFTVNVSLMVEQHMFGQDIHFLPWCGRFGVIVPVFFLYPRMFNDDVFMAMHAFFNRRQSRVIGPRHIWVAIGTLDFFHPGMYSMAEGYGLFRADIGCRRNIEKIKKQSHQQKTASQQHDYRFISLQRAASFCSTGISSGNRFRKIDKANAISPKNPNVINTSVKPTGIEAVS